MMFFVVDNMTGFHGWKCDRFPRVEVWQDSKCVNVRGFHGWRWKCDRFRRVEVWHDSTFANVTGFHLWRWKCDRFPRVELWQDSTWANVTWQDSRWDWEIPFFSCFVFCSGTCRFVCCLHYSMQLWYQSQSLDRQQQQGKYWTQYHSTHNRGLL